jgi:hypothetical protein
VGECGICGDRIEAACAGAGEVEGLLEVVLAGCCGVEGGCVCDRYLLFFRNRPRDVNIMRQCLCIDDVLGAVAVLVISCLNEGLEGEDDILRRTIVIQPRRLGPNR